MAKRTLKQEIYHFLRTRKKRTVRKVEISQYSIFIDMSTDWGCSIFAINVLDPLVTHLKKKGCRIADASYNSFSVEIELEQEDD